MKKKRAILLTIGLAVIFALFIRRVPLFTAKPGISPDQFISAEVSIMDVESGQSVLDVKCADKDAVQWLVKTLNTARSSPDHKSMEVGYLVLSSPTGTQATIAFLPGHDPAFYEIRYESKKFDLPRAEFLSAIETLGVPREKIPLSEH
jgi:hypothetical protein